MIECRFTVPDPARPERKVCAVCGREVTSKWRPEQMHYHCGVELHTPATPPEPAVKKPADPAGARREIETEIARRALAPALIAKQLAATLDRCFADCPHFTGRACNLANGHDCRQRASWIRQLASHGQCLADVQQRPSK